MFDLTMEFKLVVLAISLMGFALVLAFEKKLLGCFVKRCQTDFE